MAAVAASPTWNDRDDAELQALLEDEIEGESLEQYILRVSPSHPPPRHIRPVMRLYERARHERVLACVELPPRHAKTTTGLHGLGWLVNRDPTLTNAFATFGDDYAASRSRICRVLARAGGMQLDKSMANLHEWRTIYGGGCLFHGYQGEWTGQGIDGVGLIDDPYKDRAAAESLKIRNNVRDWFTDVFWTRLQKPSDSYGHPGSCIVQHTRWHDDDLIGWLLSGKFSGYKFERIRLPAIAEDTDDLLGREIGEALWPERVSAEELKKIEESIGPYAWASLFQQRPRPKGADIFGEPARFTLADWRPDGHRILLCCDPAATDDTRADFSAAFVLAAKGYGNDMHLWLLHGWRDHVTVPAVARKLHELQERFWRAPVAVEAVGAFKAVPQSLREIEQGLRIREVKPVGDKFTRAQAVAAAWNAGRVFVPVDAECEFDRATSRFYPPKVRKKIRPGVDYSITWADELIAEATRFTGVKDPEDDQVDAIAHGYHELWHPTRQRGSQKNRMPFG